MLAVFSISGQRGAGVPFILRAHPDNRDNSCFLHDIRFSLKAKVALCCFPVEVSWSLLLTICFALMVIPYAAYLGTLR